MEVYELIDGGCCDQMKGPGYQREGRNWDHLPGIHLGRRSQIFEYQWELRGYWNSPKTNQLRILEFWQAQNKTNPLGLGLEWIQENLNHLILWSQ